MSRALGSPFVALGQDLFVVILTHLAGESLFNMSTNAYRHILPFAIACFDHYQLTKHFINGLAILPLTFVPLLCQKTRVKPSPPPFPEVLYRQSPAHSLSNLSKVPTNCFPPILEADVSRFIAHLPNLYSLYISRITCISDEGLLSMITALPNLRILRLPASRSITVTSIRALSPLIHLHTLDLSYCVAMADESAPLLRDLPALRVLKVAYWRISDEFVRIVAASCSLRELDISACPKLTSLACAYVAHGNSLTKFSFRCSPQLTDRGVLDLASCSSLKTLDLSIAKRLTDDGITRIADQSQVPALEKLVLSQCRGLTDNAVKNIVAHDNIHVLDLSFCDLLTDEACKALRGMKTLYDIDVSGCSSITDLAIHFLTESSSIRNIRYAYCPNITSEAVDILCYAKGVPFGTIDARSCKSMTAAGQARLKCVCDHLLCSTETECDSRF